MYLGWGDIWFWAAVALLLPFQTFVWFYVSSLILVLIGAVIVHFFQQKQTENTSEENWTIPLAGGQAIVLIVILIINH